MQKPWVRATLAALLAAVAAAPAGADEALFAAARAGDVTVLRARLDAGASPNAANRHGTTVLAMAADAGQSEVARLLVERGAEVNARDRFFRSSPLELAVRAGHLELALWFLEHGASDADSALEAAVESKNTRMARAALATGRVEHLELEAARRSLPADAPEKLKQVLAEARAVRPLRTPFSIAPERLAAFAGRYRLQADDGTTLEATVSVERADIVVRIAGQADLVGRPIGEDRFETESGDVTFRFGGRGGLVESLRLNRRGDVLWLSPGVGASPVSVTDVPGATAPAPASLAAARA